jgi:hypothetical protein
MTCEVTAARALTPDVIDTCIAPADAGVARHRQPRGHVMQELVQRYIETWNETGPEARRAAVAELWAEDGTYTDPLAAVAGHDAIAALIGAVQEQFPGHRLRLAAGSLDAHHDIGRFRWELVPAAGGEPVVIGFDVAVADEDGRLVHVLGFLDRVPAA